MARGHSFINKEEVKRELTFEEYISGMNLRDKVTHLLAPGIRPEKRENTDKREYIDSIFEDKTIKPGMVLVFGGKKEAIIETVEWVSNHSGRPVLAAMDMEPSPAGCTHFGSQMAISATDDENIAYMAGCGCALEGREMGLNMSFSPVVDILKNRLNPITAIRSFGDEPARVIRFALPYMNGMQDNGLVATGKHFPGDGVDDRDQHITTTINSLSKEEWLNSYGKVWKTMIDSGIKAIMPGHIALPAFEPDGAVIPATMSRALITDLLRGELGFDGLIVTDALNMGGLGQYSVKERIVGTVKAGADCLLFPNFLGDISEIADILEEAVLSGEISEERIEKSIYRIWKTKSEIGLIGAPTAIPCSDEDRAKIVGAATSVAEKAITVVRNRKNILPLDFKTTKKVISIDLDNKNGNVVNLLDDELKSRGIEVLKYGERTENGFVPFYNLPKTDALIINFFYSTYWGTNHIRPCGTQIQNLFQYMCQFDGPVILISYGNPHIVYEYSSYADTVINTYGAPKYANALCNILFGESEAQGVPPVII